MALKTYYPTMLRRVKALVLYLVRYQAAMVARTGMTGAQQTALTDLIAALQAVIAAFPAYHEGP